MDNFDIATSATEKALNSQGSALKENQKYIESLEGTLNILKLAFEGAYSKIFNSNTLKGFIDSISKLVKVFGSIPGIVGLATTALLLFKGKAITSGIVAIVSYISTLATLALTEGVVRTATMELSLAFNTLKAAFLSNPIGILAVALTSIIGIMALFADSTDKAASALAKLDEQISAIKEQQSTLKNLASTYETLSIKTSLSSDEHKELFDVQNDIAKLAPSLVGYYDSEGNAILKTKDELDKYIESLKTEQAIKEGQKRDTYISQLEDEQKSIKEINRQIEIEKKTIETINSTVRDNGQVWIDNYKIYKKHGSYIGDNTIGIQQDKALEIVNKRIDSFNNQLKDSFDTMQNLKNQIKQGIPEFTTLSGISKQIADNLAINVDQQFKNLNSDNVKDYTNAIKDIGITLKDNKIDEQFNEYTKLTDAYQNNKLSIEEMTKAYDSLKKSLSGVGVNSKDQQKFLQLPDPSAIEFIIEKTEELDSAYKDITSDIGNLNQTISDLNEGESLNDKTLEELILKYPELQKYLVKTAEGYTLEKSAIDILNEARGIEVKYALAAQAGITKAVFDQLTIRLDNYDIEIQAIESLQDAYKAMMPYMASGASNEIVKATLQYGDAMEKLQGLKKLISDPNYGVSTTKKKDADPAPIPYQDLSAEFVKAYNAQAELDEGLAKSLEKQIKIADSAKDYNKEINLTNKLIDIRKKKITDLESSNKKITSDADRVRSTTNRDTTKWFDPNGFETSTYLNLIKSFEGKTDNASKRELDNIKRIFEALKNLKQGYMANNEEISNQIDLIDEQRQNIKKLNEEKLKLFEDTENQIMDLLKKSHQKELDGLEKSLNKYKKFIDEKKKINDEYYDDLDYKEKVAEDSQNILLSQNEINKYTPAALSGDLEAIAKIKELKEQQAEDEKNLAKTQRDYEKDLRNKNLDDNLDSFETFIDSQKQIQEDALKDSALKLEAQNILTGKTLEKVQNAIVNLFTVTSENATTAGLVIQNNLIDNLTKVLDIYKELDKLTGGSLNSSILPSKQGIVLKNSIGSRLNMAKATTNLIPNLSTPTPKLQPTGTGGVVLNFKVDTVTKESLPGLKNTIGDALKVLRNEMYNKGQR